MRPGERARAIYRRAVLPADLSASERGQLRLHLLSAFFNGIFFGSMNLGDVTLAKTLQGSPFLVTVFNLLIGLSYIGSLFFVGMMRGRPKAPFLLLFAIVGRLGLWLMGLSATPVWFVFIIGVAWLTHSLILIGQVSIIQRSYSPHHRNTLFGLTLSMTTATNLIASVALGWLLEWNDRAYWVYFGCAGIAGFVGAAVLAWMERRIDRRSDERAAGAQAGDSLEGAFRESSPANGSWRAGSDAAPAYRPMGQPGLAAALRSMRESVALVRSILREDARYRRFQNNFFLYGVAFLCLTPVVPLFLVHDLRLDYSQIGLAKGLMGQAGMILFPPALGHLMQRMGPVRFSGRMFAFLSLYPAFLLVAGFGPTAWGLPFTYAAFLCFGISMAGVNLAWHMSCLHFSGREDPSSYQAVHTVLTGLRGGFAPLLGYAIMMAGTKMHAFALSAALLVVASLLMGRMARDEERVGREGASGGGPPGPSAARGARGATPPNRPNRGGD